ncbi:MAG: transposase [Terracidiphilus sp.]
MQRTVHLSDDRTDDPKPVSPRRVELYTGSQERRRWPDETKARIVVESFTPGTVVTQLAQRHGCRAQQIHDLRRRVFIEPREKGTGCCREISVNQRVKTDSAFVAHVTPFFTRLPCFSGIPVYWTCL